MKSAYIITMHCPLNYGAILQCYGLQTFIESLGLKVTVIDYRPEYVVCDQSLMYVGWERYKKNFFTRWLYRLIKVPSRLSRRKKFKTFAQRELHLTQVFKTFEEICNAKLEADYFFCGSDQIWNTVSGSHKDPAYFLSFVTDNAKKISYAASGNLPLIEEVKNKTFPMINSIAHVSMREDSTIASIQPYIKRPITHVCDPVFLLDGDDWKKLYKKHSKLFTKKKYVLVYPMGHGKETTIEKAYQLAKELNLPLYMISASERKDFRIDKQLNVDPYTFLALINNAELIVTNSFHATAFSIILEKQFWTCVAEGSNHRIISLLEKAGLENRLIVGNVEPNIHDKADLIIAKQKLSNFISQSKKFIKENTHE